MLELQQLEEHLFNTAAPEEALLTQARLLLSPELRENLHWQQHAYAVIQQYGRQQLKAELEAVHQKLFTQPEHTSFRQKILRLFSKK